MSNDVAKLVRPSTEVQPAANVVLPAAAVQQIVTAIGEMGADDIAMEFTASQDGHKAQSRFSLRAYRRGKQVQNIDEEHDV
jgi:hypothetical protein